MNLLMNYHVSMTQRQYVHPEPPQRVNNALRAWCQKQRVAFNDDKLGQKEIELLEQVNFRFDTMNCQEVMWNKQYGRLVASYVSIL